MSDAIKAMERALQERASEIEKYKQEEDELAQFLANVLAEFNGVHGLALEHERHGTEMCWSLLCKRFQRDIEYARVKILYDRAFRINWAILLPHSLEPTWREIWASDRANFAVEFGKDLGKVLAEHPPETQR